MDLIGKYCIHYDSGNKNGIFLGVITEELMQSSAAASIRVLNPYKNNYSICYRNPVTSFVNKGIIDWDKYQESNKDNIKTMLLGQDESARQLALEILKQYNCVIL